MALPVTASVVWGYGGGPQVPYTCIKTHTVAPAPYGGLDSRPPIGTQWEDYWVQGGSGAVTWTADTTYYQASAGTKNPAVRSVCDLRDPTSFHRRQRHQAVQLGWPSQPFMLLKRIAPVVRLDPQLMVQPSVLFQDPARRWLASVRESFFSRPWPHGITGLGFLPWVLEQGAGRSRIPDSESLFLHPRKHLKGRFLRTIGPGMHDDIAGQAAALRKRQVMQLQGGQTRENAHLPKLGDKTTLPER